MTAMRATHTDSPLSTFHNDLAATLPRASLPVPPHIAHSKFSFQPVDVSTSPVATETCMPAKPGLERKLKSGRSGKGQNEMMHDWAESSAEGFLNMMLQSKALLFQTSICPNCRGETQEWYQCQTCCGNRQSCASCIRKCHANLPTHRLRKWSGHFFAAVSNQGLGYVLHLGHDGRPCDMGQEQDFVIVDVTGVSQTTVRFCQHPGRRSKVYQLMAMGIFPCSEKQPSTGVTFTALRQFHLLSAQFHLPASHYWGMLVNLSNPLSPDNVPDRYREFQRVARQWQHLQDVKRSGSFQTSQAAEGLRVPDLALRCPVCPIPNVNNHPEDVCPEDRHLYSLQLSYDGSFKLYRKAKAVDDWDTSLSRGRKYFVHTGDFQRYFREQKCKPQTSTKDANCNNHKASQNTWVRFGGLDETGLGSVICARHSFFMPHGSVSFTTGEQYIYADFTFLSVLNHAADEGVDEVGVHYDIICHYIVNMWKRWAAVSHPLRPLDERSFQSFIAAIPNFHLAGHTLACYARYSLNNLFGVGRLDAEGGERCWANINRAQISTCDCGPSSREDILAQAMGRSNWVKVIDMPLAIKRKHTESCAAAARCLMEHLELTATFSADVISQWEATSTAPEFKDGVWHSVFLLPEQEETSYAKRIQDLLDQEQQPSASSSSGLQPGLTEWLQAGIEVQHQQARIRHDILNQGNRPTKSQIASLNHRREELLAQLKQHHNRAAAFLWLPQSSSATASSVSTDGQPEDLLLDLPSQLISTDIALVPRLADSVIKTEAELRRLLCLYYLKVTRSLAMQQVHIQQSKARNPQGIKRVTQMAASISRVQNQIKLAQRLYSVNRNALYVLGMNEADDHAFRELTERDIKELYRDVGKARAVGEGRLSMPWYWRVHMPDLSDVQCSVGDIDEELSLGTPDDTLVSTHLSKGSGLRVEWFKSRERHRRWQEESEWCQREAASYILYCIHQEQMWRHLGDCAPHAGKTAYCFRQQNVWEQLRVKAIRILKEIVLVISKDFYGQYITNAIFVVSKGTWLIHMLTPGAGAGFG
ncbi:hypothetical protein RhiJN_15038 [Ceratobasidium sp. AG-Ba]|nr:hypothetical protein RhiJN_15038 [Ceratobasidium sp. AG-Ba]